MGVELNTKAGFKALLVTLALMAAISVNAAQGQPAPQVEPNQLDRVGNARPIRDARLANPQISERQAVSLARERFAGNVLRISLIGEGNNLRYQIRMENEGKVFTVFVSAVNGRVFRSN